MIRPCLFVRRPRAIMNGVAIFYGNLNAVTAIDKATGIMQKLNQPFNWLWWAFINRHIAQAVSSKLENV